MHIGQKSKQRAQSIEGMDPVQENLGAEGGISDLLLGILDAKTRMDCIPALALALGAEQIFLFLKDPGSGTLSPAPGFTQVLPDDTSWLGFAASVIAAEGRPHQSSLPRPGEGTMTSAAGVGHRAGIAFIALYEGDAFDAESLTAVVPWLPWMRKNLRACADVEAQGARMHALFMEAPAPICILRGPEHVYQLANPLYSQTVGNRELIGKTVREAFPEVASHGIYGILDTVYRENKPFYIQEYPIRMHGREGILEDRFFNFTFQPMLDAAGAVEGIMAVGYEVTVQVLARRKAEESSRLISGQKRVLEQLAEGASLPDILEVLIRIAEEQSEGVRASILLLDADGKHLRHGAAPNLPEDYNRAIDGITIGPEVGSCGTAAFKGAPVIVSDIGSDPLWRNFRDLAIGHGLKACWSIPILSSRGKVLGTFALYYPEPREPQASDLQQMDVLSHTAGIAIERKRSEDECQKFVSMVDNSGDFIAMGGFDKKVFFLNPAGRRLVGLDGPDDDYAIPISRYRSEESSRFFEKVIFPSVKSKGQWQGETQLRHFKTGESIDVLQNIFMVKDSATQAPICMATIMRDITERKQAETTLKHTREQLAQSQKMESIGKLAGGIAHDFNNLLTAINGYAALSLSMVEPEDPLHQNLFEIKNAGERAASLTRQLLAYSRKQVLAPKVLDINTIVSEMHNMLKRVIGEDLDLILDLDSGLGATKADPGQIEQVILNLVVNARDATASGGRIILTTRGTDGTDGKNLSKLPEGSYVLLSVQDTGTGMEPDVQAHIFEPFFTTKEFGKGSGMGLAMVHGIVSQSGGMIEVDSAPGKGSTFKVYLPQVTSEKADVHAPRPTTHEEARGHGTVLLVEDEDTVRKFTRQILELTGYMVLEGRDGKDGLHVSANHPGPIEVLLTDVIMPRMNGRELAEKVLEARPGIKVLFMSGYTDDAIMRQGLLDSDTDFIQKPFTAQRLARSIRRILGLAKPA